MFNTDLSEASELSTFKMCLDFGLMTDFMFSMASFFVGRQLNKFYFLSKIKR